jgi:hypothetical protein
LPLVILTPVYEDLQACSRLFKELGAVFGPQLTIVAVDDGSVRQPLTAEVIEAGGASGTVLKLKRNVGHQRAIAIGLSFISDGLPDNARVVVMDSDGEDRPDSVPALLAKLEGGSFDVVFARRMGRAETVQFKLFYAAYKRIFRMLTGRSIRFGNFMALNASAVRRLAAMEETSVHVAASVLASRLRIGMLPTDRGPRYAGKSKMNFVGLVLHGIRGMMVFAEDVLVRVSIACAIIAAVSVTSIAAAIVLKLLGMSTPGWFSVAMGILVLMLLQTGALALMSLMLMGVVRGGTMANQIDYRNFIESVMKTKR